MKQVFNPLNWLISVIASSKQNRQYIVGMGPGNRVVVKVQDKIYNITIEEV